MVTAVGSYVNMGVQILEKGLYHPSFLGRAVSWGVFYGTLYYFAKKVYEYAQPKFQAFKEGHCWCSCHKETLKGEPMTPDHSRLERKKQHPPIRTESQPGNLDKDKDTTVKNPENEGPVQKKK